MAAHTKPLWRRVMTGRFLRWWACRLLVRIFPPLGRALGFFPDHIGLIEAAERILVNETATFAVEDLAPHMEFLAKCDRQDSRAADCRVPDRVWHGARTVLIRAPWIDIATGAILLPEQRTTVLVRGQIANWNATSVRLGRPRARVAERVFAPLSTRNYFHMLTENGVRVLDLLATPGIASEPLTIAKQAPSSAVEAAFFEGVERMHSAVTVREFPRFTMVSCDEAVGHFPRDNHWEWPMIDAGSADRVFAVFQTIYGEAINTRYGERLYITRHGTKLRTPLNEPELENALQSEGFDSFTATYENHVEQIARFRSARIVVGVHGSGLANLLFCRRGTRVVEIFPADFVKSTYWWMARRLRLRYQPVIGGIGDYRQRVRVDIDRVLAALDGQGDH